jgi:hypothetical protein
MGEKHVMPKALFTTSIRLTTAQCAWLTTGAAKILKRHGKYTDRSSMLRGFIDGLVSARVDLSECSNEAEIKRFVASHFRANGKTKTAGQ